MYVVKDLACRSSCSSGDLPDYGAYHATLITDPALPGKWQPEDERLVAMADVLEQIEEMLAFEPQTLGSKID